MGPQGAQGLQGPPGSGGAGTTKLVVVVPVSDTGGATTMLPAEAGTSVSQIPGVACYFGEPAGDLWISVSDGHCGLIFLVEASRWFAVVTGLSAGYYAAFVIVY
jgi:hypothetical protein